MKHQESIILYSYFRSSCSYRVRIGLHLKELPFEYRPLHLLKDGGQQHSKKFLSLNPKGEVPLLIHGAQRIGQSMAILFYLDEISPELPLFPQSVEQRIRCLSLCEIINSGIQPLQNLKVTQELEKRFHVSSQDKVDWICFWIMQGFTALEAELKDQAQEYALGKKVSACDLFLVPQVYSAQRNSLDLSPFPTILRIYENCMKLPAFQKASPSTQIDTPPEEKMTITP